MSLLQLDRMFFGSEARLFRGGPAAFLITLTRLYDDELQAAGGIRPFQYECQAEGWGTFKLTVSEIGSVLRTPAQRALNKAKASARYQKALAKRRNRK